MRPLVVVHAEARRELIEARGYYDERREGFGPLFVDAVKREFQLIAEFPRIGKPLALGARRRTVVPIRCGTRPRQPP
jgi:plasmid stabilization system protein ParE